MTDEGLYGALPMGFENLGPEGKQSVKKVVVKLHLKKGLKTQEKSCGRKS
jgi:hypothetical protein